MPDAEEIGTVRNARDHRRNADRQHEPRQARVEDDAQADPREAEKVGEPNRRMSVERLLAGELGALHEAERQSDHKAHAEDDHADLRIVGDSR